MKKFIIMLVIVLPIAQSAWGGCLDDRPLAERWDLQVRNPERQLKIFTGPGTTFKGQINLPGTLALYRSLLLDPAHYADWFWMTVRVNTLPDPSDGTLQLDILQKLPELKSVKATSWRPDAHLGVRVTPISADKHDFSAQIVGTQNTPSQHSESMTAGKGESTFQLHFRQVDDDLVYMEVVGQVDKQGLPDWYFNFIRMKAAAQMLKDLQTLGTRASVRHEASGSGNQGPAAAETKQTHPVTPATSPDSGRQFYCPDDI